MTARAPRKKAEPKASPQGEEPGGELVNVRVHTAIGGKKVGTEHAVTRDRYERVLKPYVDLIGAEPAATEDATEAEGAAEGGEQGGGAKDGDAPTEG